MKYSKYILIGLVILGLIAAKLWHKYADTKDLLVLISPTTTLVSISTGLPFELQQRGYFCQTNPILIDKSCAGFNFWVISFCTLFFGFLYKFQTLWKKISYVVFTLLISYLFTIIANTSRIVAAIKLGGRHTILDDLSFINVHEMIGVFVYFSFLLIIYNIFRFYFHKKLIS